MQDTAVVDDGSCKITVKVLVGLESVSWQVYELENLLTGISTQDCTEFKEAAQSHGWSRIFVPEF